MKTQDNGKATAIVSYLWIIGWLIAYFGMYKENKTSLATYHLRQTLLYHIVSFCFSVVAGLLIMLLGSNIGYLVVQILGLGLLILWIIGLVAAIQGQEKAMPFIGGKAQSLFSTI